MAGEGRGWNRVWRALEHGAHLAAPKCLCWGAKFLISGTRRKNSRRPGGEKRFGFPGRPRIVRGEEESPLPARRFRISLEHGEFTGADGELAGFGPVVHARFAFNFQSGDAGDGQRR